MPAPRRCLSYSAPDVLMWMVSLVYGRRHLGLLELDRFRDVLRLRRRYSLSSMKSAYARFQGETADNHCSSRGLILPWEEQSLHPFTACCDHLVSSCRFRDAALGCEATTCNSASSMQYLPTASPARQHDPGRRLLLDATDFENLHLSKPLSGERGKTTSNSSTYHSVL